MGLEKKDLIDTNQVHPIFPTEEGYYWCRHYPVNEDKPIWGIVHFVRYEGWWYFDINSKMWCEPGLYVQVFGKDQIYNFADYFTNPDGTYWEGLYFEKVIQPSNR